MAPMTSQSAIAIVQISSPVASSCCSSWLKTVGHLSYVCGVKTLLITPVLLSQAPVRIAVHEGFEIVVCPTMLGAEVVLVFINLSKFGVSRSSSSSSTLLKLVPSIAITRTCCSEGFGRTWLFTGSLVGFG